jgi:hypothetical protein
MQTAQHRKPRVRRVSLQERFWRSVDKRDAAECWLWTGGLNRLGYGVTSRKSVILRAHRVSYELHFGPIPAGMHVLHSCDNRRCVNPAHLRTGTHKDNMRDRALRKRTFLAQGELSKTAKVTAEQVLEIRRKRAAGIGPVELGREYGLRYNSIWNITTRRTWRHLP